MFEIRFSEKPIQITTAGVAPDEHILDVGLQSSTLTLVARCVSIVENAPGPELWLSLQTCQDLRSGKWFDLGSFNMLDKPDEYDKRDFTGVLRYIRWEAGLANADSAHFEIFGVAR
jgi:hypothetical protein